MARAESEKQPFIITFKGGASHTPWLEDLYHWKRRQEWIDSGFYQDLIQKSNAESEDIINYIIANDPNSIIILLGDHGPYTYRFLLLDDLSLQEANVTPQEVMDDSFDVFLAYRMPNGEDFDLTYNMYMNNLNLFTHIFAYLAEDESILLNRARSESFFDRFHAIEGVMQDQ